MQALYQRVVPDSLGGGVVNFLLADEGHNRMGVFRDGDCLVTNAPQRWRCGMIEHAIAIINLVAAIAQLIKSFR
jgi:hypothetical protein